MYKGTERYIRKIGVFILLKIFTTQLQGSFQKIAKEEEFSFEDGARLLAQAIVGEGDIYIYGAREMKAVVAEAIEGVETLPRGKELHRDLASSISIADRALIVTRYDNDEEAIRIANTLTQNGVGVVAISTISDKKEGKTERSLSEIADVHIDLRLKRGLIPDDDGSRFGFPTSMLALYAYYGIAFTLKETLDELE